jgi:general secretion pathway protein I
MTAAVPRQAGFTLLEVLVALAILSLAVVASIEGFAQGLRLLKLAGDHQNAMLLADQKVREVVEPVEGIEAGTDGLFRWERATKVIETPDLVQPGVVPRGRIYEIDVRVNWDPRRQIEIRTLRTVSPTGGTFTTTGTPGTPGAPGAPGTPASNAARGGPTTPRGPQSPR